MMTTIAMNKDMTKGGRIFTNDYELYDFMKENDIYSYYYYEVSGDTLEDWTEPTIEWFLLTRKEEQEALEEEA